MGNIQVFFAENGWILLDAAVILIFLGCISFAFFRGFMKSSYTIISLVLTIILMYAFQAPFEDYIAQSTLGKTIAEKLTYQITQNAEEGNPETGEDLGLPQFLLVKIQGQADAAGEATQEVIAAISAAVADSVIQIVAVVLLFLLIRIGVFILLKVLDAAFKLPILNLVNKTAGVMMGILNALLLVYLLCAAVTFLVPAENLKAFDRAMNQTYIANIFYNNNLLMELFM